MNSKHLSDLRERLALLGELTNYSGQVCQVQENAPVKILFDVGCASCSEIGSAHADEFAEALCRVVNGARELLPAVQERPTIVCLCGSTRFGAAFADANFRETLAGKIVLTIGCDFKSDAELFAHLPKEELEALKDRLDTLHLRKIDLADEVFILNVGGYIGDSTRRELAYAQALGKVIRWLEPPQ